MGEEEVHIRLIRCDCIFSGPSVRPSVRHANAGKHRLQETQRYNSSTGYSHLINTPPHRDAAA